MKQGCGNIKQIVIGKGSVNGFAVVKGCPFFNERFSGRDDLANMNSFIKGSTQPHHDDVFNPQGSKGFHSVRCLRRAASSVQKAQVEFLNFPDWTAIQKSRERLGQFFPMILLHKVIGSLAYKEHNRSCRQMKMTPTVCAVYLLGCGNNRF